MSPAALLAANGNLRVHRMLTHTQFNPLHARCHLLLTLDVPVNCKKAVRVTNLGLVSSAQPSRVYNRCVRDLKLFSTSELSGYRIPEPLVFVHVVKYGKRMKYCSV